MKYCEANEETIKQHRNTAPFPLKKKKEEGKMGEEKKFLEIRRRKKRKRNLLAILDKIAF